MPDAITPNEFPARSPLRRAEDAQYRRGAKPMIEAKSFGTQGEGDTTFHARNFLDCVKTRAACNCDIETGHRSTSATLIANVAHQTRALLEWDAKAERFTNHPEANRWLSYSYRPPYRLPGS